MAAFNANLRVLPVRPEVAGLGFAAPRPGAAEIEALISTALAQRRARVSRVLLTVAAEPAPESESESVPEPAPVPDDENIFADPDDAGEDAPFEENIFV